MVEAAVDRIESFGLFVKFAGGRGLVPASESGTPHGTDLRRTFKVGDAFPALVLQIDERGGSGSPGRGPSTPRAGRRPRLHGGVEAPKGGGKGFGTLGDLLKKKLK